MSNSNNEATTAREKYVEKVRKLLAKAERAGSPEEAEAFFAKVTVLMTEWEIDEAELRDAGEVSEVIVTRIKLSSYSPDADNVAMSEVAACFDLVCGFKPYRSGDPALTVLVGRKDDTERFMMLWPILETQLVRHMRNAESPFLDRGQQRRFRMGFKIGFTQGVADKMKAARAATVQERGLVLVKDDVQQVAADVFNGVRKTNFQVDHAAQTKGYHDGQQADIGQKGMTK